MQYLFGPTPIATVSPIAPQVATVRAPRVQVPLANSVANPADFLTAFAPPNAPHQPGAAPAGVPGAAAAALGLTPPTGSTTPQAAVLGPGGSINLSGEQVLSMMAAMAANTATITPKGKAKAKSAGGQTDSGNASRQYRKSSSRIFSAARKKQGDVSPDDKISIIHICNPLVGDLKHRQEWELDSVIWLVTGRTPFDGFFSRDKDEHNEFMRQEYAKFGSLLHKMTFDQALTEVLIRVGLLAAPSAAILADVEVEGEQRQQLSLGGTDVVLKSLGEEKKWHLGVDPMGHQLVMDKEQFPDICFKIMDIPAMAEAQRAVNERYQVERMQAHQEMARRSLEQRTAQQQQQAVEALQAAGLSVYPQVPQLPQGALPQPAPLHQAAPLAMTAPAGQMVAAAPHSAAATAHPLAAAMAMATAAANSMAMAATSHPMAAAASPVTATAHPLAAAAHPLASAAPPVASTETAPAHLLAAAQHPHAAATAAVAHPHVAALAAAPPRGSVGRHDAATTMATDNVIRLTKGHFAGGFSPAAIVESTPKKFPTSIGSPASSDSTGMLSPAKAASVTVAQIVASPSAARTPRAARTPPGAVEPSAVTGNAEATAVTSSQALLAPLPAPSAVVGADAADASIMQLEG